MLKPHNIGTLTVTQQKLKDMNVYQKAEALDKLLQSLNFNDMTSEEAIRHFKKAKDRSIEKKIEKVIDIADVNYADEKTVFLNTAGKSKSEATKESYGYAIAELENFCSLQGKLSPLFLTSSDADDYLSYLENTAVNKFGKPLSVSTIRRDIAVASSFFTFLARRNEGIKNIFAGLKNRPAEKLATKPVYPSKDEVDKIYKYIITPTTLKTKDKNGKNKIRATSQLQQELASIVYIMAYRGLRCGAFENLIITRQDNTVGSCRYIFETESKGKTYRGRMPDSCIEKMKKAGIKTGAKTFQPFPEWTSEKIRSYVKYYTNSLYNKTALVHGLDASYSCHDFRHYFAMNEYQKDHDIYRLKELLNHADISTTAIYLRTLGADIKE